MTLDLSRIHCVSVGIFQSLHGLLELSFVKPRFLCLKKKQEQDDPGCAYEKQLIRSAIDIEQLVWFWNHCLFRG